MNLPIPFALDPNATFTTRRVNESITNLFDNFRYNITKPLQFETYPEDIYTTPLIRDHHVSYFYYIETHSLTQDVNSTSLSIILNTQQSVYNKHIYPSNIFIPISQGFVAFLAKLEELNNLTDEHTFLPSAIQSLQSKETFQLRTTPFN